MSLKFPSRPVFIPAVPAYWAPQGVDVRWEGKFRVKSKFSFSSSRWFPARCGLRPPWLPTDWPKSMPEVESTLNVKRYSLFQSSQFTTVDGNADDPLRVMTHQSGTYRIMGLVNKKFNEMTQNFDQHLNESMKNQCSWCLWNWHFIFRYNIFFVFISQTFNFIPETGKKIAATNQFSISFFATDSRG